MRSGVPSGGWEVDGNSELRIQNSELKFSAENAERETRSLDSQWSLEMTVGELGVLIRCLLNVEKIEKTASGGLFCALFCCFLGAFCVRCCVNRTTMFWKNSDISIT